MGLFSKDQIDQINKVAKKSQAVSEVKVSKKASSINDEILESSKAVQEYFSDSPAILITNKQQLHEYVTAAIEANYVGIDTETTGLDRNKDYVVGASLYYPGGVECYIPFKHRIPIFEDLYKNQLSYEDFEEELNRFVDAKTHLIFANANFDLYMIWKDFGVDLCSCCYYDVILAWRCLKEDELHNGLKDLYNKYVLKGQGDPKKFSDFFSPQLFPYCKPEIAKLYAANDAKITYELFKWQLPYTIKKHPKCQKNHLEHIADLIWYVEFPLIEVCQKMERTGMYIDQDRATSLQKKYRDIYTRELSNLKNMVAEVLSTSNVSNFGKRPPFISADEFNPRSTLHVKYLLYDLLQLPKPKGKESTGVGVISEFNLPITNKIVEVRSLATNISTFVDKLPEAVSTDGRIHADFKQIGAACITADSIVACEDGYHRISELGFEDITTTGEFYDLEDVIVLNSSCESEIATHGIYYENVPTIKITTDLGITLEGTFNHPVLACTNDILKHESSEDKLSSHAAKNPWNYTKLENLSVGDFLKTPCSYTIRGSYQSLDYLGSPDVKCLDEDIAEFFGICYHYFSLHDSKITFMFDIGDDDQMNRLNDLSNQIFHRIIDHKFYNPHDCTYYVDIHIPCIDVLYSEVISKIWRSPSAVINRFIRGLTSSGGQVNSSHYELSLRDKYVAQMVHLHLLSQGIISTIADSCIKIPLNLDGSIPFLEIIGCINSSDKYVLQHGIDKSYVSRKIGNHIWSRVESIEMSKNNVYDIHVPYTHSFIANGLINHNTGRLSSANPNLMNIPSKLDDIRQMFRATPASYESTSFELSDNGANLTLKRWQQVLVNDRYTSADKLAVGDRISVNSEAGELLLSIADIEVPDNDNKVHLKFSYAGE